jgi:small basic protein
MILIPILALVAGIIIGILFRGPVPGIAGTYLAVACIAAIDTICGGIRSGLEGRFHQDIFITGFLSNVVIAFFLAWLGDRIGINLFLVSALILGGRIFTNLSLIRRFLLTRWQEERERKARQAQQPVQQQANPT